MRLGDQLQRCGVRCRCQPVENVGRLRLAPTALTAQKRWKRWRRPRWLTAGVRDPGGWMRSAARRARGSWRGEDVSAMALSAPCRYSAVIRRPERRSSSIISAHDLGILALAWDIERRRGAGKSALGGDGRDCRRARLPHSNGDLKPATRRQSPRRSRLPRSSAGGGDHPKLDRRGCDRDRSRAGRAACK